jgi:uncharacterized protein
MTVTPPWAGASLTGPGEIVLALLVVAYCVLAQPLVGYRLHRRMEREVAADPARRWHGYARLLVLELVLGGVAVAVAAALNGIGLQRIGLSGPHRTGSGLLFGVGLGIAILVCVAVAASTIAIWRLDRPIPVVGGDHVRVMVPVRRSERVWFLALSAAAGVCEELLFRGLLPALLSALLHGPPAWFVILLAAIAFGAAHAYQGTAGVTATGILGALMGIVYVATGSLFVVMVLHALIDARVGLLPARALGRPPGEAAPA